VLAVQNAPVSVDDLPSTVRPLTARSVVLSTLLGYHPPELPVSALVRVGGLFGLAEGAVRVALGRMVADGDLIVSERTYRLAERLLARQRRQDEACSPRTKAWRGAWETEIVTAPPRPLAERVALRRSMAALRLAELREGVWMRPANLVRERHATALEQCSFFLARPQDDPTELAGRLWDLDAWAAEARRLQGALDRVEGLVAGFMITADVLHHLLADPMLPAELLPADWPGAALRRRYAEFSVSYAEGLRAYSSQA
jgi:phenylacetic acid degradation operon negative regulatory protein